MQTTKSFNAKVMLQDLDLTATITRKHPKNYVTIGVETKFYDTNLMGKWGRESYPLVKSDQGVLFDSPFIASAMIRCDGIVLNEDMDPVFHCMHTPSSAYQAGIPCDFLQRHITPEDGSFPKVRFHSRYPVAIPRLLLLEFASEEIKAIYLHKFGVDLKDLTCDYVPSYKKSQHGGICSVWSVIVEIAA